ncbi:MAG: hypothetical protein ABIR84_07050 [Candidatus Nitrotoga sp.]
MYINNSVLAGIEMLHMICKGQTEIPGAKKMSFADLFYVLAGNSILHKDNGAFRGLKFVS